MATIYDIAKKLGVSSATVSRVLNGVNHPVSGETKAKILETAQEMNYRPNTIAKSLTKGRTDTIAILLPSIINDFYTQFVDIIENNISAAGYSTFLCNTHRNVDRETRFISTLIERRVDGVVFCPTRVQAEDNAINIKNVETLRSNHIPVTAIGSHFEKVSRVYVDTFDGAKKATEYLVSLGHRKIGFIDGLNAGTSRRRFKGYSEALREAGIGLKAEWVCSGDLTLASGEICAEKLFQTGKPTAVLAVNNQMAVGVLKAAKKHGVSVPREFSVIGFDDSPVSELVDPSLTVVRQPLEKIGANVTRLLTEQIGKKGAPELVRLETELVIRNSCACIK